MKRKLLKQTVNEWRSNIWLALELLIVSVVMWFITDWLYTTVTVLNLPRGFNTDHCYLIGYRTLNAKSPDYIPNRDDMFNDDMAELMTRLENRPEVEAVAIGLNAYFYNGSNSTTYLQTDTFSTGNSYVVRRYVTPDFTRVFRIEGSRGETPEQLAEILRSDPYGFLVADDSFRDCGKTSMTEFIGYRFYNGGGQDTLTLLATYKPTRYDDFEYGVRVHSMIRGLTKDNYNICNELVVRVKDKMDVDFAENLMKEADGKLRVGNIFISSVTSFDTVREMHQRSDVASLRNYLVGAAFLALNIFLGLLGTFWFRTQQRVHEIAIRKANGATKSDIFRRVISEGLLVLLFITPAAIIIDWLLTRMELNTYYNYAYYEPVRFWACVAISWAAMALMIILGVIIPANRAMNIAPAEALNEE